LVLVGSEVVGELRDALEVLEMGVGVVDEVGEGLGDDGVVAPSEADADHDHEGGDVAGGDGDDAACGREGFVWLAGVGEDVGSEGVEEGVVEGFGDEVEAVDGGVEEGAACEGADGSEGDGGVIGKVSGEVVDGAVLVLRGGPGGCVVAELEDPAVGSDRNGEVREGGEEVLGFTLGEEVGEGLVGEEEVGWDGAGGCGWSVAGEGGLVGEDLGGGGADGEVVEVCGEDGSVGGGGEVKAGVVEGLAALSEEELAGLSVELGADEGEVAIEDEGGEEAVEVEGGVVGEACAGEERGAAEELGCGVGVAVDVDGMLELGSEGALCVGEDRFGGGVGRRWGELGAGCGGREGEEGDGEMAEELDV
jgi:hypothetical protein